MEVLEEKKLSLFRKYYLEASVIFLALVLGLTVNFVININNRFVDDILKYRYDLLYQLQKSNNVIENNTEVIKEVKNVIKDNNEKQQYIK